MLLSSKVLKKMLFLDIETVSAYKEWASVPEHFQSLWALKSATLQKNQQEPVSESDLYTQKAGIFAEFAKIVCISVGLLQYEGDDIVKCKIKSFAGHDESLILKDFCDLLNTHYKDPEKDSICGHNVKEFDIPFLCRRLMINRLPLPSILDISGKKPWQTQHLFDTMDMWRFGDYKNYTSLNLLAAALDIPTPKDDIDGSMVGKVYWEDQDTDRISTYCQKDVLTVVQVMLTFAGIKNLTPEQIEFL